MVELTTEERESYNAVRMQALASLNSTSGTSEDYRTSGSLTNMLHKIEAMRMICNLGVYYGDRDMLRINGQSGMDWQTIAQKTFDLQREIGQLHCHTCGCPIENMDLSPISAGSFGNCSFSRCWKLSCSTCTKAGHGSSSLCKHKPTCPTATVAINGDSTASTRHTKNISTLNVPHLPTKVNLLLKDLNAHHQEEKRYVSVRKFMSTVVFFFAKVFQPCVFKLAHGDRYNRARLKK